MPHIQKQSDKVALGFDRIAFIYDAMACIFSFNRINKSQLALLSYVRMQSTCLILGGGSGLFLQRLLEENSNVHITYVDASEKMIQFAKARVTKMPFDCLKRVTFVQAQVEEFVFEQYDVIICNYFLDVFEQHYVEMLVDQFRKSLSIDGLLYVTDFNVPNTKKVFGWLTNKGIQALYMFFKCTTSLATTQIVDMHKIILENQFEQLDSKDFFNQIVSCKLYKMKRMFC